MTQFPLRGFGPLERPGGKGQAAVFPLAGDRGALSRQHEEWAGHAARGALAASKEVGVEERGAAGCRLWSEPLSSQGPWTQGEAERGWAWQTGGGGLWGSGCSEVGGH